MGLELEDGIHRVAAETDGSTGEELEVAAYDVLDGQLVDATLYLVGAKHVEVALIKIGGAYRTIAVEGYVVARLLVHEHPERGIGGTVNLQIEVDVAGDVYLALGVLLDLVVAGIGSQFQAVAVLPVYERLVADALGARRVVFYE